MTGSIPAIPSCSSDYIPLNETVHANHQILLSSKNLDTVSLTQPSMFLPTQTIHQVFFYKCFELGLIDKNGTWIPDNLTVPLPPVDEAGMQRIDQRLNRVISKVTKNLKTLNPFKFNLIKNAFDKIAHYCKIQDKVNPFSFDTHHKIASININIVLHDLLKKFLLIREKHRIPITHTEINGGDLPSILGSKWYHVLKQMDPNGHLDFDWDSLLQDIDDPADDLDLTLHVPLSTSYEEMEELIHSFISIIAESFGLCKELNPTAALLVKELAFSKYAHIYENKEGQIAHFFTLSFDDENHTKIDLCFASNLIQKQLFHRHGLKLDITKLLLPHAGKDTVLIPYSEVSGGWQAIFDRVGRIVNATNIQIPYHYGWVRLISSLIKGNCCPREEIEPIFRKEILFWSPQLLVDTLFKIIFDHNKGNFDAFIASVFISSTLLQDHFSDDYIAKMWSVLRHYFDRDQESTLFNLAKTIWDQKLSFRQVSDVLHAASLYQLSLPFANATCYQLVIISGKPCISVSFRDEISLLLFYKPVESMINFSAILSESQSESALKLFRLLIESQEGSDLQPSLLSHYPALHPTLKQVICSLPNSGEGNLLKFGLNLAISEKTEQAFVVALENLISLTHQESETKIKIRLLDAFETTFDTFLTKPGFSYLRGNIIHQGKSVFGIYKSTFNDLTADGNPQLCKFAYDLWSRSTRKMEFHTELGWEFLKLIESIDPILCLKTIEKLIKTYPEIDVNAYHQFIEYIDKFKINHFTLELTLLVETILHQLLSKMKVTKFKPPVKHIHLIFANLYDMCDHNLPQKAFDLLRLACEKRVIANQDTETVQVWLEIFRKMVLNPELPLVQSIEILEKVKQTKLINLLEKDPCYHKILLSIAERCLHENLEEALVGYLKSVNHSLLNDEDAKKMQELVDIVIQKKIACGEIKSIAEIPYTASKEQIVRYQVYLIQQAMNDGDIKKAKTICLKLIKTHCHAHLDIKSILYAMLEKDHISYAIEILSQPKIEHLLSPSEAKIIIGSILSKANDDRDQYELINLALHYLDEEDGNYFNLVYSRFFEHFQYQSHQIPLATAITQKISLIINLLYNRGRIADLLSLVNLLAIHGINLRDCKEEQLFPVIMSAIKQSYQSTQNLKETHFLLKYCLRHMKKDSVLDIKNFLPEFLELLLLRKEYTKAFHWISIAPEPQKNVKDLFVGMIVEFKENYRASISTLIANCPIKEASEWKQLLGKAIETLPSELLEELSIQLYSQIFNSHITGQTSEIAVCLLILIDPQMHCPPHLIIEMIDQFRDLEIGSDYEFTLFLMIRCRDALKKLDPIDRYAEKVLKFRHRFDTALEKVNMIDIDISFIRLTLRTQNREVYYQACLLVNKILERIESSLDDEAIKDLLFNFLLKYPTLFPFEQHQEDVVTECILKLLHLFHNSNLHHVNAAELICRRFSKVQSKPVIENLVAHFTTFVHKIKENSKSGKTLKDTQFLGELVTQIIHNTDFLTSEDCMMQIRNESLLAPKIQDTLWFRFLSHHLNTLLASEYTDQHYPLFISCMYRFEFIKHDFDKFFGLMELLLSLAFKINENDSINAIDYKNRLPEFIRITFGKMFTNVPEVSFPGVFFSPKSKLVIENKEKVRLELTGHLCEPLIGKLSSHYVSLLINFCNFLMTSHHTNEANTIRTIDFVFYIAMKLISTQSYRSKDLSLLVQRFCFFSVKLNDETIFDYNIRKGLAMYRYAVTKDIFEKHNLRLLNCIYICELNEWIGSGISDKKRLEVFESIIKEIIFHRQIPALRHGFNMMKSLAKILFHNYPTQFVQLFSDLITTFKDFPKASVMSIFILDKNRVEKPSYKAIDKILGSSPYLSELNSNLVQIGATINLIPFYKSIDHILLPNRKVLFSDDLNNGTKYSLQLVSIFIEALLEVHENDFRITYFLCHFVRNIHEFNCYHSNPNAYFNHVAKIRGLLSCVVDNPSFENRQKIYKHYEKLLFIKRPCIRNIYSWIQVLMNSSLPEDNSHGKEILERALRAKLYATNLDHLKHTPS